MTEITIPCDVPAGSTILVDKGQFVGVQAAKPALCADEACVFVANGPHAHDAEGYLLRPDGAAWDAPTEGEKG